MAEVFNISVSMRSGDILSPSTPLVGQILPVAIYTKKRALVESLLDTDDPWAVSFSGLGAANILVIQSNGPISIELTPTDGAPQTLPVNGLLVLSSLTTSYEALTVTRASSQETAVTVFLLEQTAT